MQGKKWCFTLNNYAESDFRNICDLGGGLDGNGIKYLVVGREVGGDNGTPHLQGFVVFDRNHRLGRVKSLLGVRIHAETARGSEVQASEYCKKDGDFVEFGTLSGRVGRPRQPSVADFCSWVRATPPLDVTEQSCAVNFPALWLQYGGRLLSLSVHLSLHQQLETRPLRGWQLELESELTMEADDRTVMFYVDREGGKGKSFFIRWMYTTYPDKVQMLGVGKRDDLAFVIDKSKSIFLLNVPRGGLEFLQYTILEQLKDRTVYSPKYQGEMKVLQSKCHVAVFCNEHPDMEKMSQDRYKIVEL